MKILIISHKPVFPSYDGGSLATKKIYLDLKKEYNVVDIIALKDQKIIIPNKKNNENQILFTINTNFNLLNLIKSFFNKNSYQVTRFYKNKIAKKIINIINKKQYNYVLFEGVFPSVYLKEIKLNCNCKTIIRTHNVEHEIWGNLFNNTKSIKRKFIYFFLKKQMKKWENFICSKCDFLFCISKNDQLYFNKKIQKKTELLPVSFELKKIKKPKEFSIFHLGAMDWKPNIEGIEWFLQKVWYHGIQKNKSIKLYLAGKKMPDYFRKKQSDNLIIEGMIENAENYMMEKTVMVVPLFSGSGIRIKIIEGMSMGIPIISTPKGAQGIPYTNGKNILICKNSIEFKKAIENIQKDENLFNQISQGGRDLVKSYFSTNVVLNNWKKLLYETSYHNTQNPRSIR